MKEQRQRVGFYIVVDDKLFAGKADTAVRQMLRRVLESEHYQVVTAGTGRETAVKFLTNLPDLVLLDLNMPDQDGREAFDLMTDRRPFVPVIVITATPQQYQSAVDYGIDALMEKPLNLPLLLATITDLLAESEPDRVRRLSNRDFKTVFLNNNNEVASSEAPL